MNIIFFNISPQAKKRDTKLVLTKRTQDSETLLTASTTAKARLVEEVEKSGTQGNFPTQDIAEHQESLEDNGLPDTLQHLVIDETAEVFSRDSSCQVDLLDNRVAALTITLRRIQDELEKRLKELVAERNKNKELEEKLVNLEQEFKKKLVEFEAEKVKNKKLYEKLVELEFRVNAAEKKLLKVNLDYESFVGNDAKTKYFTGFCNHKLFFILHETIAPHLSSHPNTRLSTFKQLLLTLMKLRLNLPFEYLARRFASSHIDCISVLFACCQKSFMF